MSGDARTGALIGALFLITRGTPRDSGGIIETLGDSGVKIMPFIIYRSKLVLWLQNRFYEISYGYMSHVKQNGKRLLTEYKDN